MEFWREFDVPACVCDGLLVALGRGDTGTEFRSGAMLSVCVHRVLPSLAGLECRSWLVNVIYPA